MRSTCDRCRCTRPGLVLLLQPRKAPAIWRGVPGGLQDARESDGAVGAHPERRCRMKLTDWEVQAAFNLAYDRFASAKQKRDKLTDALDVIVDQAYEDVEAARVVLLATMKDGAKNLPTHK